MEREIGARRPAQSKSEGLSTTAKVFFGLNIFQVIAIGGIQGAMIVCGNFEPVSQEGLGPGRRIYMALFLGAVLYSCFLCLFAVKKQNFLEILAFVLQNYAYIIYSGIQVYHISFKKYEDHAIKRQPVLVYLTIIDSIGLLVLNTIFTYLAAKLFCEYGWKIYKRVRFNIRLRAAFHLYETVLMLLKMLFLFLTMFAICLNQTLLHDQVHSFSYIASLASIPLCLIVSIIGVISIRRELKYVSYLVILAVLSAIVYFIFKMSRVASETCTGCLKGTEVRDIPGEVDLHILYLGSVNLILLAGLFVAFIKAVRNFGMGLAEHFKTDMSSKLIVLNLSKNVLTSIVTSSGEERDISIDLDTPRPSVSNEPRPSVFQYLPRFIGTSDHVFDDAEHSKSMSLPAHLQKRDNIAKQIGRSAKSRISQIFWESDFSRFGSHRNSVASSHYSSCFQNCCFSLRGRRNSFSEYIVPEEKDLNNERDVSGDHIGSQDNCSSLVKTKTHGSRRKRSRSMGDPRAFPGFSLSRRRLVRVNSLPTEKLLQTRMSHNQHSSIQNFSVTPQMSMRGSFANPEFDTRRQLLSTPSITVTASCDDCETQNSLDVNLEEIPVSEGQSSEKTEEKRTSLKQSSVRPILQRRAKSSIPSFSSTSTHQKEAESDGKRLEHAKHCSDKSELQTRSRKLGVHEIPVEPSERLKRALSEYDLHQKAGKKGKVHFLY